MHSFAFKLVYDFIDDTCVFWVEGPYCNRYIVEAGEKSACPYWLIEVFQWPQVCC